MVWRIFIVLTLLAVVALSVLSRRQRPADLPLMRAPEPPRPGYFMTDATIVQTGADGLPLYRMSAERIQQNPQNLSVRLDKLKLNYSQEDNKTTWTLTADTGLVPSIDAQTIDLQGNVAIAGHPKLVDGSTPSQLATIHTSRLKVDAANSIATTREPVDIKWGNYQLSAVGLTANLKTERLKLESAIHGRILQ